MYHVSAQSVDERMINVHYYYYYYYYYYNKDIVKDRNLLKKREKGEIKLKRHAIIVIMRNK